MEQPATSSDRRQTLIVLTLAATLRFLVVATVLIRYPSGWFFERGVEMGFLARSLLDGLGLSSPFGGATGPTAFIAPGYPLLIAAVFRVFGVASRLSAAVIMSSQVLINLVTIWLLMHLAQSLFNRRTALTAGLLWSCSLPLLWVPTIFWDTSLSICLLLGLLVLVLQFRGHVPRYVWLLLGLYCAMTALTNPALLFVIAAILLWLVFQVEKSSRSHALLAVLSFGIAFAPWPIRNALVFHSFVPLRTTVGFELWMGNHDGATGYLQQRLFPLYNQAELAEYRQLGEIEYTATKSAIARRYIQERPGHFLAMTSLRFVRFWSGTGTEKGSIFFPVQACFTSVCGLAGLYLFWKEGSRSLAALFATPLLIFPIPYYCTHAEFRYRLILDPLLTLLASYFLIQTRGKGPDQRVQDQIMPTG